MVWEPKTIDEQIECLARLTEAPESFVGQVKVLFLNKGIDLEEDATPYLKALEEAFKREEAIRSSSRRVKRQVATTQQNFRQIGRDYVTQLERLKKIRTDLQQNNRTLRSGSSESKLTEVRIPGNHRSFVTNPQRDQMPMVPGPEEPQ